MWYLKFDRSYDEAVCENCSKIVDSKNLREDLWAELADGDHVYACSLECVRDIDIKVKNA